jgi:hypothetical protein
MYVDIDPIVEKLGEKKWDFIARCRRDIEREVSSRGRMCLAIREVGVRTHCPAPDSYLKVLWKFRNGETYHGHKLESVLSEPVSAIVVKNYSDFLEGNKPDIEATLKREIFEGLDVATTLEQILYEELQKRGLKHVRKEAAKAFIHSCQAAIHSQIAHSTAAAVSSAVTSSVGTIVGTAIGHALRTALSHAIGAAVMHAAHSAAFKGLLHTAIMHSVGVIVTVVLVKMIATHMTAASAGAILGPIAWVAGGTYVLYKILTIPETLGEKLGDAVAAKLNSDFRTWTEKALQSYVNNLKDPEAIMKSVVKAEIDSHLPEIAAEVTDTPKLSHDWDKVNKDAKELVHYSGMGIQKIGKKTGWLSWFS